MINQFELKESDIGRTVIYHRLNCRHEVGNLSSWNDRYVFVRFKGPSGEACEPFDVTFEKQSINMEDSINEPQ